MEPTLVPGTLNYIEGWVVLDGHQLPAKSVNTTVLEVNQMLDTKQGKAELLLIPGAFLRIGDQSRIRMVSSGLADTRVERWLRPLPTQIGLPCACWTGRQPFIRETLPSL